MMNNSEMHTYEVNLQWEAERRGVVSSPILPIQIEVATPPEFPKGMKDIWTPEHLFVAAINSCLMATFLDIAENSKFEFISFKSNAIATVAKVEGKWTITEIVLKPTIILVTLKHEDQLREILEMSEKLCAISNSIKTKIYIEPIIKV